MHQHHSIWACRALRAARQRGVVTHSPDPGAVRSSRAAPTSKPHPLSLLDFRGDVCANFSEMFNRFEREGALLNVCVSTANFTHTMLYVIAISELFAGMCFSQFSGAWYNSPACVLRYRSKHRINFKSTAKNMLDNRRVALRHHGKEVIWENPLVVLEPSEPPLLYLNPG